MIADRTSLSEREQRFQQALVECLEALEAGQPPNCQDLLARYPEFAAELAELLRNREKLDRLTAPLRALAQAARIDTPPAQVTSTCGLPGKKAGAALPAGNGCFGDYELLEEIARGGMGIVYKARQKSLNRIVALKMILAGHLASAADVERFRDEAEAAASLDHPHIVPIYEVGQWRAEAVGPPVHYFTMKLIEGGSLAKRIGVRDQGPGVRKEEQKQAARLVATVARAVHYAHQRSILHRDLKPSNILLDTHGQPYVTDFGLAKRVQRDDSVTGSGTIVGTPLYMAPEQAAGDKRLTTAADIYSLGAILYELLTGKAVIRAAAPLETVRRVQEQEPVRPRGLNPQVDRDLETICLKCLDKEPQRRYGSAEALAEDLDRWLAGEPIQARPVRRVERLGRWCRRNPVVAALIAAVILVAGAGFLGVFGQWQVALANEQKANANAAQAQQKEQEAIQQRDEVRALNDQLQRTLYSAHMNLAQHAWDAGGTGRVLELLDQHRPKPGEQDPRGFEWYYLHRLCHSDLLTFNLTGTDVVSPFLVHSVAFSPDGKRVANYAYQDKTLKVSDAQTGQELLTLKGHSQRVTAVTFSPDGKRLASGTTYGLGFPSELKVWDAQTGQEILTLKGHIGLILNMAFSPDGKRLVSSSYDGAVKVWDAQTGQELLTFKGHTGGVASAVFSPDGKRLASASYDQTVKVWDAQSGQELLTHKGTEGFIGRVAFSPDGKRLAAPSYDGTLKVWDAQTGQELLTLKAGPRCVAFSPDGNRLAGTSSDSLTVKVWDAQTGQELFTLKGHSGPVLNVAFTADGKRLVCSTQRAVKVFDAQPIGESLTLKVDGLVVVAFSPDSKRLASASNGRGGGRSEVKLWDAQSGEELLTLKEHVVGQFVSSVAFSPDGKRLASGISGFTGGQGQGRIPSVVKVWDAQSGQESLTLKLGHTGVVQGLAFSPDGKRLAAGSFGGVKVWDALSGQEILTLKTDNPLFTGVAFSPDGKRLASASNDRTVKVWDAQTGQELLTCKRLRTLSPPESAISRVAFSPDGKRLASGSEGGGEVWDAQTGEKLLTLQGGGGDSLVFSPDGRRLAGGCDVGVRLRDAQTGQELLTLEGGHWSVAFSPDGRRLAGSRTNGTINIWDATPVPEKPQPKPAQR